MGLAQRRHPEIGVGGVTPTSGEAHLAWMFKEGMSALGQDDMWSLVSIKHRHQYCGRPTGDVEHDSLTIADHCGHLRREFDRAG
jgi:hypothetical protein